MQKSSTCSFMYGDLTDKTTIKKLEEAFENLKQEQVEILLYKKNSKYAWIHIYGTARCNLSWIVLLYSIERKYFAGVTEST